MKRTDKAPLVINGDKQFCLIMMYIVELIEVLGIKSAVPHALVNTPYTNSQADKYLDSLEITHVKAKTGVRHGYETAKQYVIGAHCDHSGHGGVHVDWVWLNKALRGKEERIEAKKLRALLNIVNASGGGDAIATLLMIECVLRDRDYSVTMLNALYKEHHSGLFKATVTSKNKFLCNHDETKLIEPPRL